MTEMLWLGHEASRWRRGELLGQRNRRAPSGGGTKLQVY